MQGMGGSVLGGALTILALAAIAAGRSDPTAGWTAIQGLIGVALGLSFVTGYFSTPFLWVMVRRRRDIMLADVDVGADADGLRVTSNATSAAFGWSFFRRARELQDFFLLEPGTGHVMGLWKRGADETQLAAFRALLAQAGLVETASRARRRTLRTAAALVLGVIVAPAFAFVAWTSASAGTATMSLSVSTETRAVTVRGTSNLPDGASIAVQILHVDALESAEAAGAGGSQDARWILVEYVDVSGGHFTTTFSVPSWPAGRVEAGAYFWISRDQPAAVTQRYGSRGESMTGPDVVMTRDRGRMLEVFADFDLR